MPPPAKFIKISEFRKEGLIRSGKGKALLVNLQTTIHSQAPPPQGVIPLQPQNGAPPPAANWEQVTNWNPRIPQRVPQSAPPLPPGPAFGKRVASANKPPCAPYKDENPAKNSLADVSRAVEGFSLDLFDKTVKQAGPGLDIVISPFSVWSTLTIVAEGALHDTFNELARTLKLPLSINTTRSGYRRISQVMLVNTSTVELEAATAIFTDNSSPINRDYECLVESVYRTDLRSVSFLNKAKAAYDINMFIKEKTRNRIDSIVVEQDLTDAKMIITNAVFFRGQWTTPFNKTNTKVENFYDETGAVKGQVNMMYDIGYYPYTMVQGLNSHIIEIPYGKENRLSMYVLLPMKGVLLQDVLGKVKRMSIHDLTSLMNQAIDEYGDELVELRLPRFKISSDLTLNIILEEMGILSVFDPNYADLSRISNNNLYVSRIMHKAEIEVTEEGTVASAVTGVISLTICVYVCRL
ncbi:serine protease inhibitor 77Ba-like [Ctenocephalides felis]|uniref:serine protease inhibitor 77Ba-like n=1 Tax=Ctenocephalides felis TaxID=7515 RepID=UPI000E6E2B13|nr:serine protease inhibitor 77Ba-like [Ctenocephalides felis]